MSVRSPDEVDAALAGGADIVDAKDPARGALGLMEPGMLVRVLDRVPSTLPFSVALGDPPDAESAAALIDSLPITARAAPTYVKLGLARVDDRVAAGQILVAAAAAAVRHSGRPRVIAVAYADGPARPGLDGTLDAARRAGVGGVLVDTMYKNGGSLLDSIPLHRLNAWIVEAHGHRLLVALAGRLDRQEVAVVANSGADVIGVRGAACDGGRAGQVIAAKVRGLRDILDPVAEERRRVAKHQSTGRH